MAESRDGSGDAEGVLLTVLGRLLRVARRHENSAHAGAVCENERANLIAYLCHGMGVRGDFLKVVAQRLAHWDRACPGCDGCRGRRLRLRTEEADGEP